MKGQLRDPQSGQFAFDGRWDRLCVCGHTLGVHCAGGFDCLAGTNCTNDPNPPGKFCDCQKFCLSRRRLQGEKG